MYAPHPHRQCAAQKASPPGGGQQRVPLEDLEIADDFDPQRLLEINDALDRLAAQDNTKAEVVKLRFFAGLENREVTELLRVSELTVERAWRFAKGTG